MTAPEGSPALVLIADDDALVRRVLRMALESRGYAVIEASNADEVQATADADLDLVVLDINMPGGTVHEMIGHLRDERPRLPILVLSGDAAPPADLHATASEFARKPIELDELLVRVSRLLAHPVVGE